MKRQIFILFLILLVRNGFAQVPAYVSTAGLIGWWSFTGNANDSSGHGYDGTITGATLAYDRFGNPNRAYSFDGYSHQIDFSLNNYKVFSISIWFKAAVVQSTNYPTLFSYHDNDYDCGIQRTSAYPNMNNLRFYYHVGDFGPNMNANDNNWHHLYSDIDVPASYYHIYIDGNLISQGTTDSGSAAWDTTLNAAFNHFVVGNEYVGGAGVAQFKGILDDVAFYNRLLSVCEITKLYLGINSFIITNPVNNTVVPGGYATYTITDTGTATYQWQENGGTGFVDLSNSAPYSGVTTKTLTISPAASSMNTYQYRCIRNNTGTCPDTSGSATLFISGTTGIDNISPEQFSIVPNPANALLTISSKEMITSVVVTNLLGQTVFSQECNLSHVQLNVADLPSGVYLLRINSTVIRRFIKN